MSILDGLLGKVSQNLDVNGLAQKVGLDPSQVEGALASLAKSHDTPGDTVAAAAADTGIDSGIMSQIMDQIGGEGALGQFSEMLKGDGSIMDKVSGFFDKDGDGNPLNDLTGMVKGLFGKQ